MFGGCWDNPDATRNAFTDDGWLRTGDLGHLDTDGFPHVTGRKKDLIVTAAGKHVAPAPIEEAVRAHPLVSQCVLVGDGRPYVVALMAVDLTAWQRWRGTREGTVDEPRDDPRLRAEVQLAVDRVNHGLSRAEQVKTFRILPRELTEVDGELTPTLKVIRAVVTAHVAADIDDLYRGHAGARPADPVAGPAATANPSDGPRSGSRTPQRPTRAGVHSSRRWVRTRKAR